jgi:exopolyphosphatase / guanosine-5'-triphosphate,3'-diphosphate pyrophosphatase
VTARAAIDIGSNSVRLFVAGAAGEELCREMNITRLAEGVDATGELASAAIARTIEVLQRYAERLREFDATRLRVTATSAARDAKNRSLFFSAVENVVGKPPELLSGAEEAALAFAGATRDQPRERAPFLTLDIGGGSTEFALGATTTEARVEHSISLDLGCVRVTERFLKSDPVLPAEFAAARAFTRGLLEQAERAVPCRSANTWLGLAGTVTSVAAMTLGLKRYDPSRTHGFVLTRDAVESAHARLAPLPERERAALLLEPKRASVMLGGTVILVEVMQFFGLESIVVSERDILDGLVGSLS